MKRNRSILGVTIATFALAGCGAPRVEPQAPNAAPAPAEESTMSAPAEDREEAAPASGAAAPAAAPSPSSTKAESDRAAPADIEVWGRKLDNALTLSTPDCGTAWMLRDRICDLAQRLCDIAGRSAEPDVAERCSDGRSRCERATARVRAACPD